MVQAVSASCPLELEQCLLRQLKDLSFECPDHLVEYSAVEDTQQVELTIDTALLRIDLPYVTWVQLPGEELRFVREEELGDADSEAYEGDAEDDDSEWEDAELSALLPRGWFMEHWVLHSREEDDDCSRGGFTSDDDSASTQVPESWSSSILSDDHALEDLTVCSDSGSLWGAERSSTDTAEEVEPDRGRMGYAELRDTFEGPDLQVAPSPGESARSDDGTTGGSDEECPTTAGHLVLDAKVADQVPDVCPTWKFVPRSLVDEVVRSATGSCAAYYDFQLLEASILGQWNDILRDSGLAMVSVHS